MTVTNQNCIYKRIKSTLNSGNACYHTVQNLSLHRLLSKHMKIKIQNYNFIRCFVLVWNLISHPKWRTQTEDVCEQGEEEKTWETKQYQDRENYTTRSFVLCTLFTI